MPARLVLLNLLTGVVLVSACLRPPCQEAGPGHNLPTGGAVDARSQTVWAATYARGGSLLAFRLPSLERCAVVPLSMSGHVCYPEGVVLTPEGRLFVAE